MTKSTITREQLLEIIETDHVQCGEASYLARMALSAMDSEPVAWRWNYGGTTIWRLLDTKPGPGSNPRCPRVIEPLYRHTQPPMVPGDVLNRLEHEANHVTSWHHMDEHSCKVNRRDLLTLVNACRATMLAAAPHDTPALNSVQNVVTVPGKWIPVSERMPEDEQEVLTINKMGHRFVSFFDKRSGLFFDRLDAPAACCIEHVLVTHWMPLPAAPQEIKS